MATDTDPLAQLSAAGVAVWLDDLSRERLRTGNLGDLIRDRHVVGVTTNPTIFQKAISGADAYAAQLDDLATRGVDVGEALRAITTSDVRWGCDVLRPGLRRERHRRRPGLDRGRPAHLRRRGQDHRRGAGAVVAGRPAQPVHQDPGDARPACPAISQALAEGISVNVTLIFSLERYGQVIDAFLDGLERAQKAGLDLADHRLGGVVLRLPGRHRDRQAARQDRHRRGQGAQGQGRGRQRPARVPAVRGEVRRRALGGPRRRPGAKVQRPLWASTGVKDPAYDDTMYVVDLVADHTVNTMPEPTLQAVARPRRDHRRHHPRQLRRRRSRCSTTWPALGISYDDVVETLERRGRREVRAVAGPS